MYVAVIIEARSDDDVSIVRVESLTGGVHIIVVGACVVCDHVPDQYGVLPIKFHLLMVVLRESQCGYSNPSATMIY